ncbi:MAG: hypothetical protein EBS90_14070, partial [Betaproteobacteria bacterium]|nr:hypothetical protein [Betaproteobacteria bacterium]
MLLPGCSCCGAPDACQCTKGSLPETVTISLTNQNVSPCACDWDRAASPRSNHTVVGHRTSDVLLDNP